MRVALAWLILLMAGTTMPTAAASKALDNLLSGLQVEPLAGQTPPAFELERLSDGKKVALAEYRGQPVMLYFWATW